MALPHRENPRVTPEQNPSPQTAELLNRSLTDGQGRPLTIYRTMARHPALFARWTAIAGFFRHEGVLSARIRELAVLRTAWRIDSPYEWGQHVLIGRSIGLSEDDIDRIAQSHGFGEDNAVEAVTMRCVDELVEHTDIADATWDKMCALFTVEEAMELVMLVGLYKMAGGFINAMGVQPEPGLPTWPAGSARSSENSPATRHGSA